MRSMSVGSRRGRGGDDGFTLIEVVIAIAILVAVCAATLPFLVKEKQTSALFQHELVATSLASTALEAVSAHSAFLNSSTSVSNLVTGRTATTVSAAWAANSTVTGVGSTYQLSDPTAGSSATPLIPITGASNIVNGTSYTTTTLIGECYAAKSTLTSATCGLLPAVVTPPSSAPSGYVGMIRVIVVTSWSGDTACATSGACRYSTATLINIDPDLTWVS